MNRRQHWRSRRLLLAGLTLVSGWGCGEGTTGRSGDARGTVVITEFADPTSLFPPVALNAIARQATELIYEYLADVGVGMNTIGDAGFVPQLASAWSWSSDSLSLAFRIHDDARWHDGRRVTAADVAFSFGIYGDSAIAPMTAESMADIDSVTERDSTTAVFWFARRNPRQFYTAAAQMLILPAHLLQSLPADSLDDAFATADPVGSGQFRFVRRTPGASLELRAVREHHRGSPLIDRLIWSVTPEYRAGIVKLLAEEADVFPNVRKETVDELTGSGKFNVLSLPGMDYAFMQMNLRDPRSGRPHPLFASRDVRRALTMALDRQAMVKNLFDTLGSVAIGPGIRAAATMDTSLRQIPFDREAARRALDSLGWRLPSGSGAGRGIRSRGGLPLRFRLLVPVSSLSRMNIAVLIQEQLRLVGAEVVIEQMDYSAFTARQAERSFDAALASWTLGSSPEAVRVTWSSRASEKGGLNYGGYANPRFDALVDSALDAGTLAGARAYFRRAHQVIIDDAPAVWLYEPRLLLAVHSRIVTPAMRPNSWWLSIPDWKIASEKRIARDGANRPD